jgi:hypothetical protein
MKAYIAVTGFFFVVITVSHIARVSLESHLARDPWFVVATVVAAGMSFWALLLLWKPKRPSARP